MLSTMTILAFRCLLFIFFIFVIFIAIALIAVVDLIIILPVLILLILLSVLVWLSIFLFSPLQVLGLFLFLAHGLHLVHALHDLDEVLELAAELREQRPVKEVCHLELPSQVLHKEQDKLIKAAVEHIDATFEIHSIFWSHHQVVFHVAKRIFYSRKHTSKSIVKVFGQPGTFLLFAFYNLLGCSEVLLRFEPEDALLLQYLFLFVISVVNKCCKQKTHNRKQEHSY